MFDQILSKIRTVDDQEKILEEIDVLLSSLYQDKGLGFESTLKTSARAWLYPLLREEFSKEGANRRNLLLNLKQKIEGLSKVYITLAFEPSEDALNRFGGVIRTSVREDVIISVAYDPHLIGGVQIIYNGEFRHFSFKRIFEKEFENTREQILKSIKN